MSGPEAERRKAPRFGVILTVTLRIGERVEVGKSRDISERGIFVRTLVPAPAGERVDLTIESEIDKEPLLVRGRVVHVLPGLGSGIEFLPLPPEVSQRIKALIRALQEDG